MPYRYRDDIATADAAFEAWGESIEELFIDSAVATMNIMVESTGSIAPSRFIMIDCEAENIEMLLLKFLEELIFYKDCYILFLLIFGLVSGDCFYYLAIFLELFNKDDMIFIDPHVIFGSVKLIA